MLANCGSGFTEIGKYIRRTLSGTVNIHIFSQYIYSGISQALDARKYDVSDKMNHYR